MPTLVALEVAPEAGIAEYMALETLRNGTATTAQFNVLAECSDMLTIGASMKGDEEASKVAQFGATALLNIRDRYDERGRVGATGDELAALRVMVEFSRDWWCRQSGETFRAAYQAVDEERAKSLGVAA